MIQLVTSEELLVELFEAYAPALKIKELGLTADPEERAQCIFKAMEQLVLVNPAEHSAIFKVLNTIAVVNSDPANHKVIVDYLKYNFALKKVYDSLHYAATFSKRRPIAAMAAFIAIQCKSGNDVVRGEALKLWDAFIVECSKVAQGNFLRKNITPPSKGAVERARGLKDFQSELENYVRLQSQQKDYIAFVVPNQTTSGYTRYYVNTSPPERDVLQVKKGKSGMGKDINMTGFEIRHYYVTDRVWISETKTGDQAYILDLFLKNVLGSTIDRRHRVHCEHRLPVFRSKDRFLREITLPIELSRNHEKVYLSQLKIVVAERHSDLVLEGDGEGVYMPVTYEGTEYVSIHDQIAKIQQRKFPSELWTISYAEVVALLHPYIYDKETNEPVGRSSEFTKVTFPVKPGGCTPRFEARHKLDQKLREDALMLRARWELDGVNDETFYLGMTEAQRNGGI
ncbi:MAG: hypothetical protein MJ109_00330 [Kiritimatiellae bacterium]|nr:hypothetical protein [Kiritimatiellia bacterium]